MKDAAEAIDRLLSQLGTVLRYIAPGFATLLVIGVTFPGSRPFLLGGSSAVVVLGMLLGPAIYGIHTGVILRFFFFFIVLIHKRDRPPAILREMSDLDKQRWLRRIGDREAKAIQDEMDKWSSMLNYMYCLSYTMVLIPLSAKNFVSWTVSSEVNIVLTGGLVVLVTTLISDWRSTGKEIKFALQYPDGKKQARIEQTASTDLTSSAAEQ